MIKIVMMHLVGQQLRIIFQVMGATDRRDGADKGYDHGQSRIGRCYQNKERAHDIPREESVAKNI